MVVGEIDVFLVLWLLTILSLGFAFADEFWVLASCWHYGLAFSSDVMPTMY